MHTEGLIPRPELPLFGYSFTAIVKTVEKMRSPVWHDRANYLSSTMPHSCTLGKFLKPIIVNARDVLENALTAITEGLQLGCGDDDKAPAL